MKILLFTLVLSVSAASQAMTVLCKELDTETPKIFLVKSDGTDLGNEALLMDDDKNILFSKKGADAVSSYPCAEFGIDVVGTTDEENIVSLDMSAKAIIRCDAAGELYKETSGFQLGLTRQSDFPNVERDVLGSFEILENGK